MDMRWPLYGDILPRLQGTKIRGCQFCLPSALTLPCSHSMWSLLSGFSLRSETKVPGPEAFTAVTTLQMSALSCSLSLLPSKKTPYVFKFASFPIFLFRTQYKPPQETESVCAHVCGQVYVYMQEQELFSRWVSSLPSLKGRRRDEEKEGETLTPLRHSRDIGYHQMLVIPLVPHGTVSHVTPPSQITSPTITVPCLDGSNFQTAQSLLWSKALIIFNHVYRSDCIPPLSIFVSPLLLTHLISYVFSLLPLLHFFINPWVFKPSALSPYSPVFLCSTILLPQP